MEYQQMPAFDAVVVGSGAAGYSAAMRIRETGKSVCIVTENVCAGTSRNTGSDKQTYYKLGLGGSAPDSVRAMAQTLFEGGCVDGDNALCEAALSAKCFYKLCELGVAFPSNRYGEYIGYKTDHDPFARATSAGPLTSKYMTEALQREAQRLKIPVYDGFMAVEVLRDGEGVTGIVCIKTDNGTLHVFPAAHGVLATGGPAGIYRDSVYPESQSGSTALALEAGAALQNITEWQYGLASVRPRWNVSGTYMQVLPRFVSVDGEGREREFLAEAYTDPYEALSAVFLKGYQWPFDIQKAENGSSVIDLLVYRETVMRGRRVFLDYTRNPFGLEQVDFSRLSPEAYDYLRRADACFGTPIRRLEKMNEPAVALYRSKGVELTAQPLEIALCAQHSNGGIGVDCRWQTDINGLYAVGECAGTHGITRPGGSALNAGQVGALRAAQHIGASQRKLPDAAPKPDMEKHRRFFTFGEENVEEALEAARARMSACGGAVRNMALVRQTCEDLDDTLARFHSRFRVSSKAQVWKLYRLYDTLLVQRAVLGAMENYYERVGASRGSALYTDSRANGPAGLEEVFRFRTVCPGQTGQQVQQVRVEGRTPVFAWRPVRPVPPEDTVFETVWREYREENQIDREE